MSSNYLEQQFFKTQVNKGIVSIPGMSPSEGAVSTGTECSPSPTPSLCGKAVCSCAPERNLVRLQQASTLTRPGNAEKSLYPRPRPMTQN